jgi:hypothetical protein
VLKERREAFDKLVQYLLVRETVDGSEVYARDYRLEPTGGEVMT